MASLAHNAAFALLYVSYVAAYLCKKNYSFWLNGLVSRREMDQTRAAVFGSTMELAYGAGKLAAGPLADNLPPKAVLLVSLAVAAVANGLMFTSGVFYADVGLWALNGFAQSFAWPALALVFFNWFGDSPARATLYSLLSTNQNVGSALTPVVLTPLVSHFGWRAALWGPAVAGLATVFSLLVFLRESPRVAVSPTASTSASTATSTSTSPTPTTPAKKKTPWSETVVRMLTSPDIWFLGAGYAFLTAVRVAVSDWSLVFLTSSSFLGLPSSVARDCLVSLETGGFVGGLAAGAVSDGVFRGRRGPVMVIFAGFVACPAVALIFLQTKETASYVVLNAAFAALGFGSFGPHVLVGLIARELFPEAPSTAGSFAKSLAQVGGSLAGVPVSLLAERAGWKAVGSALTACMGLSAVCFAPLMRFQGDAAKAKAKSE